MSSAGDQQATSGWWMLVRGVIVEDGVNDLFGGTARSGDNRANSFMPMLFHAASVLARPHDPRSLPAMDKSTEVFSPGVRNADLVVNSHYIVGQFNHVSKHLIRE
jgi:hypothetical protein